MNTITNTTPKTVIENKPLQTLITEIDTISRNNLLLTEKFFLSLIRAGVEAVRVSSIEEVVSLYDKSGPEIENILNTMTELGLVNVEEFEERNVTEVQNAYQIWVRGALGVAENGAIWLEESAIINKLLPFTCEYLIIVLHVEKMIADMYQANAKIKNDKEGYGVFLQALPKSSDDHEHLSLANKSTNIIVYLIDPKFAEAQKLGNCGPGCCC